MVQGREDARAQLEADTKIKVAEINAEARLMQIKMITMMVI